MRTVNLINLSLKQKFGNKNNEEKKNEKRLAMIRENLP